MPTYVYECPKCRKQTEILARISEARVPPVCMESGCDGKQEMQQVIFPVATHFHGSGWTPKYGK